MNLPMHNTHTSWCRTSELLAESGRTEFPGRVQGITDAVISQWTTIRGNTHVVAVVKNTLSAGNTHAQPRVVCDQQIFDAQLSRWRVSSVMSFSSSQPLQGEFHSHQVMIHPQGLLSAATLPGAQSAKRLKTILVAATSPPSSLQTSLPLQSLRLHLQVSPRPVWLLQVSFCLGSVCMAATRLPSCEPRRGQGKLIVGQSTKKFPGSV